ncbi:MAG: phosphatidylserine decarboxylase [Planctomycetes bacterium]|nr:phosphatidylserine decarboxylase [Planctomycetota bacterium]MCB9910884.1 phosphatidylserine decarboxylase [Planctomycetota bacterium]MCB9912095.1 phosphatidylserine decarboxylase [Planctomycetota bacterium]
MSTPVRYRMSLMAGWLADRWLPTFLRAPIFKAYCWATGADWREARGPLHIYPSLGRFFVRELREGLRPIDSDPSALVSPVDGTIQDLSPIEAGTILQAKGHRYSVSDLLAGVGEASELEGGQAWTIYLGPKDYHRIHSPCAGTLVRARWVAGTRYSVQPRVLARRMVLPINERCPLRIETEHGPIYLVLVGALIVGRIKVVGLPSQGDQKPNPGMPLQRGGELARFEMGSTIVLLVPKGSAQPTPNLAPGQTVRLGSRIGTWSNAATPGTQP